MTVSTSRPPRRPQLTLSRPHWDAGSQPLSPLRLVVQKADRRRKRSRDHGVGALIIEGGQCRPQNGRAMIKSLSVNQSWIKINSRASHLGLASTSTLRFPLNFVFWPHCILCHDSMSLQSIAFHTLHHVGETRSRSTEL